MLFGDPVGVGADAGPESASPTELCWALDDMATARDRLVDGDQDYSVARLREAATQTREVGGRTTGLDRQAAEVDRVKRSESGMILNPITLSPEATLREAVALMQRFRISGVQIVDVEGRLVGIITNRDLQFERALDRLHRGHEVLLLRRELLRIDDTVGDRLREVLELRDVRVEVRGRVVVDPAGACHGCLLIASLRGSA